MPIALCGLYLPTIVLNRTAVEVKAWVSNDAITYSYPNPDAGLVNGVCKRDQIVCMTTEFTIHPSGIW